MGIYTDNYDKTSENTVTTLVAVGDIMLGEHPICVGHGVNSIIQKKGPDFVFGEVSDIFKEGDIVFGNLESVLSDVEIDHNNMKSVQLRGSENSVNGLTFAGFNVLSLANNHILEHGMSSLIRTKEVLSKNNIHAIGVAESKEKSRDPFILKVNGITFGFLAYCLVNDETAYCSVDNSSEIIHDIKKVKDDVDNLIVSLHWGNEFVRKPSPKQISLAHSMIDAGANLILGHHPHVLQGIEKYNNGVIAYSLGNFIFDMWQKKMRESIIFSCKFSKNAIIDFEIIPVYISDDFQPFILNGDEKKKLLCKVKNEFLNVVAEDEYQREVKDCRNQYRVDLVKHICTNFFRYNPRFLYQICMGFFKKHL